MPKGMKIPVEGEVVEVEVNGLKDMQDAVGGYIEAVRLTNATMYINEEGRLQDPPLPFNQLATVVAGVMGAEWVLGQGLLGDALVVGPPDGEGYDTDIDENMVRVIRGTWMVIDSAEKTGRTV